MQKIKFAVACAALGSVLLAATAATAQGTEDAYRKNHELACNGWFSQSKGLWYDTQNGVWVNDKAASWFDESKKAWVRPNCAKAADAANADSLQGGAYGAGGSGAGLPLAVIAGGLGIGGVVAAASKSGDRVSP